jgi:hypothetical protein
MRNAMRHRRVAGAFRVTPVGTIAGLPVFVDPQLDTIASTGQDTIIVGRFSDYWLYESPMHLRVLDEVLSGTLSLRAQGWTNIAGASRFDKSFALIKGTGTPPAVRVRFVGPNEITVCGSGWLSFRLGCPARTRASSISVQRGQSCCGNHTAPQCPHTMRVFGSIQVWPFAAHARARSSS